MIEVAIHPFSARHLKPEQVTDMYKVALSQVEAQILEARINLILNPDDEASAKKMAKLISGLPPLEEEYEQWLSSNSSAGSTT
jgi:hypothetical protein